jgi:hypothetical protein
MHLRLDFSEEQKHVSIRAIRSGPAGGVLRTGYVRSDRAISPATSLRGRFEASEGRESRTLGAPRIEVLRWNSFTVSVRAWLRPGRLRVQTRRPLG